MAISSDMKPSPLFCKKNQNVNSFFWKRCLPGAAIITLIAVIIFLSCYFGNTDIQKYIGKYKYRFIGSAIGLEGAILVGGGLIWISEQPLKKAGLDISNLKKIIKKCDSWNDEEKALAMIVVEKFFDRKQEEDDGIPRTRISWIINHGEGGKKAIERCLGNIVSEQKRIMLEGNFSQKEALRQAMLIEDLKLYSNEITVERARMIVREQLYYEAIFFDARNLALRVEEICRKIAPNELPGQESVSTLKRARMIAVISRDVPICYGKNWGRYEEEKIRAAQYIVQCVEMYLKQQCRKFDLDLPLKWGSGGSSWFKEAEEAFTRAYDSWVRKEKIIDDDYPQLYNGSDWVNTSLVDNFSILHVAAQDETRQKMRREGNVGAFSIEMAQDHLEVSKMMLRDEEKKRPDYRNGRTIEGHRLKNARRELEHDQWILEEVTRRQEALLYDHTPFPSAIIDIINQY